MAEINKRIAKIRYDFCYDNNKIFAEKLGKSNTYASMLCSGGTNPSQKMLDHIIEVFPAVSKPWLMLGEGEMLAGAPTTPAAPTATTITNNSSGNNNYIGIRDTQTVIMAKNDVTKGKLCDRISEIRAYFCGDNNKKFSMKTNINESYCSGICNGSKVAGDDVKEKILSAFPQVNKIWLYFGEGEMLSTQVAPTTPAPALMAATQATTAPTITNNGSDNNNHIGNSDNQSTIPEHVLRLYESLLKEKDETISTLRYTIKTLTAEIEQLRNYVSLTSSKYINVMERMMYTTNETATIVKQCSAKIGFLLSEDTDKEPKLAPK